MRRALDIGAGHGVFLSRLEAFGISTLGYESETDKVRTAVTKSLQHTVFTTTTAPPGLFDLIALPQSIYFIGPVPEVLLHLRSFLNPEGFLFIATSERFNPLHFEKYQGHRSYSREEYGAAAAQAGLRIIDWSRFAAPLNDAFNAGTLRGLLRFVLYWCGLLRPVFSDPNGNHTYILLQRVPIYG